MNMQLCIYQILDIFKRIKQVILASKIIFPCLSLSTLRSLPLKLTAIWQSCRLVTRTICWRLAGLPSTSCVHGIFIACALPIHQACVYFDSLYVCFTDPLVCNHAVGQPLFLYMAQDMASNWHIASQTLLEPSSSVSNHTYTQLDAEMACQRSHTSSCRVAVAIFPSLSVLNSISYL